MLHRISPVWACANSICLPCVLPCCLCCTLHVCVMRRSPNHPATPRARHASHLSGVWLRRLHLVGKLLAGKRLSCCLSWQLLPCPYGTSAQQQRLTDSRVWCCLLCVPAPDCDCYAGGTEGNACRKDPRVGMCVCKPNFQGTHCDQCAPGHYGPSCQRE